MSALWPLTPGNSRSGYPEPRGLPRAPVCAPTVSPGTLQPPEMAWGSSASSFPSRPLGSRCPWRDAARSSLHGSHGFASFTHCGSRCGPSRLPHPCDRLCVTGRSGDRPGGARFPGADSGARGISRGQGARVAVGSSFNVGSSPRRTPHLGSGSPLLQGLASRASGGRPVPAAWSSPP